MSHNEESDDRAGKELWRLLVVAVVATSVIVSVVILAGIFWKTLLSVGLYIVGYRAYRWVTSNFVNTVEAGNRGIRRLVVNVVAAVAALLWLTSVGLVHGVIIAVILLGGHRLYRWLKVGYFGPTPDPNEPWQDIVIEAVREKPHHKRVVLRNTSDSSWDLSGAIILDDNGEEFTIRSGSSSQLASGEAEEIPVDERIELTPGKPVTLRVESGERSGSYELRWQEFLGGRGSGG